MIQLYAQNVGELIQTMTEERRQQMLSLLCVERKMRVERIRIPAARDKEMLAGIFLQNCLNLYCMERKGEPLESFGFACEDGGKPYLPEREDIQFNLSHSGDWVVIAVGDSPVGIDVQQNQKMEQCLKIAGRCFHPEEYQALRRLEPEEIPGQFTVYWTMKEAYVKYTGKGLRTPLREVLVIPEENRAVKDSSVQFLRPALAENYSVALCCRKGEPVGKMVNYIESGFVWKSNQKNQ